jgi:hypothetical protein
VPAGSLGGVAPTVPLLAHDGDGGPPGARGRHPVLVVDAANVIGSRPTGWWRDRSGAAREFVASVRAAVDDGRVAAPVVVVLEGAARAGAPEGGSRGVRVRHAAGAGDDTLVDEAARADGAAVVVSADRELCRRVEALGASTARPGWLLGRLEAG